MSMSRPVEGVLSIFDATDPTDHGTVIAAELLQLGSFGPWFRYHAAQPKQWNLSEI